MTALVKIWHWFLEVLGIRSGVTATNPPASPAPEPAPVHKAESRPVAEPAAATPAAAPVESRKATNDSDAPATPEPARPEPVAAKARPAKRPEPPVVEGKTRFIDLDLDDRLKNAIADIGFDYCTPIQAETLPYTLAGRDLIGQAQTGTGKTAAFLINAIQRMLEQPIPASDRFASEPRVLALAPTRELAMQIAKDAEQLCGYTGHNVVTVVGGMNYDKQRDQLQNEVVDILVATPGRLIDFLGSQDVFLDQLDLLILDEADRMLDMGFIPDVKRIIRKCTPKDERQTLLFSATFNQDVLNLASMWTRSAEFVEIEPEQKTAERVQQTVYLVGGDEKLTVLVNYLQNRDVDKAIVFANRRDQCRDLDEDLRNQGIKVALMSGEIPQNKRLKTLDQFKRGDIQVLVATDVAGRGIHVEGVTHVFNYNLPENAEDYVHRIGRTGRAGKHGISVSFASEDDAFSLPAIESYIGQKITSTVPDEELMKPLEKPLISRRRGGNRRPAQGRPQRQRRA
ncbi:MAG: DEAD/DEAH box helicase [Marinobacter sp.]|uniref:DEAD/DEAH box helicase n=1 Tax=Marinobacter sp. TaxID=50741 RepID=UPI00299D9F1F|nr:DEAD/DEAH box helicase [Marinobacter sp.]MDX1633002.1 DEAD/DEAH box helicase [Marinobacter sp.]